jgi:hypothetical protein
MASEICRYKNPTLGSRYRLVWCYVVVLVNPYDSVIPCYIGVVAKVQRTVCATGLNGFDGGGVRRAGDH